MLKQVPLFASLADEDAAALEREAVLRSFPKGAVVVSEGDETDSFYIIVSGAVKIYGSDGAGKEIVFGTLTAGAYFGELALLDGAPRSASVMTLEACKLLMLPRRSFARCLDAHPPLAGRLLKELAGRVRHLTESAKSLALSDVYGRVVRTLYALAEERDGALVVSRGLTHYDIACRVGASREMVSRILKELTVGGYLEARQKRILIRRKLPATW